MKTAEVLIVGAGPAGLAAAITLASEGRSVILLEKSHKAGGQAGTSSAIENYPPFSRGFAGAHFSEEADAQCRKFGVQIEYGVEAQALIPGCNSYTLLTSNGPYHGRAVLLALGLHNRHLGLAGEDLPGVYHGMRVDALPEVSAAHVVLVGGGNSVGQAAVFYASAFAYVTIITRRPLHETMSHYLVKRLQHPLVVVRVGQIDSIVQEGGGSLRVLLEGSGYVGGVDCVHILIGQEPRTDWLGEQVQKDRRGYLITDRQHMTNLPGVFAVGDVVSDAVRRVACAVGYANQVVPAIHRYLDTADACQVA